ncbi:MAG: dihydropteroate synthase [Bifidobacterium adolescentis]
MAIDMKAIHDSQSTLVMGVLNITEDSFSDGGLWLAPEAAKAHGEAMMKAGADIIDIGAESTRPGAKRVSEAESTRPGAKRVSEADEKARVLGAVDALIPEGAVLSIDTTRASVALAALEHGAQIINDVSGGQLDRELPHVVADHSDCLYIVQHWRGWLAGAAGNVPDADTSRYEHGVVNDVYDELMRQVDAVLEAGVQAEQVIIDPGLGFSKPGVEHNLPILAALDRFNAAGYPVLIGASRKRFVGSLLAGAGVTEPDMASKDNVTAAISALCAEHGVWAVRVHDVAKSRDAVAVGNAWREYANA